VRETWMGSGIFSQIVEYDSFVCENIDCLQQNYEGYVTTDDWGNYSIECSDCYTVFKEGNVKHEDEE
jgi:hypothetical protein